MLQLLQDLQTKNKLNIAYFSGEETQAQISERNERIHKDTTNSDFAIYHSTHLEDIITTTETHDYDIIVIDSIQTIYSAATDSIAGSVGQVKYCSEKISERCKANNVLCFIVGHVTK
jgi:DNA repair protein RadA/Sms